MGFDVRWRFPCDPKVAIDTAAWFLKLTQLGAKLPLFQLVKLPANPFAFTLIALQTGLFDKLPLIGAPLVSSFLWSEFYMQLEHKFKHFRDCALAVLIEDEGSGRAALVASAAQITAESVNRIVRLTGGLFFVALSRERSEALFLDPMPRPRYSPLDSNPPHVLAQSVSVEARSGVTTGISAADRAVTIAALAARDPNPRAIVKPGHIFPVTARDGGLLVRNALPEGALDLVRLVYGVDAAVFVDLLCADGELADARSALKFAEQHNLACFSLSELTRHRLQSEQLVSLVAEARLPTTLAGELRSMMYRAAILGSEHLALTKGEWEQDETVLVRVQAESTLHDVFGNTANSSRQLLHAALRAIAQRGKGVLVYLRQPSEISPGHARMRGYGLGAQIVRALGVKKIDLLTNTAQPLVGINTFGLEVVKQTRMDSYLQELRQ